MYEVHLENAAGWEPTALQNFLQFAGVLKVDGHALMQNGRFLYAVIFFATEGEAAEFAKAAHDAKK